ncbi:PKD domain-containing protein, partial [Propioniciclava soli]|uniref:PKD domain-containing protein n=1 Tax=Propioniciclava soli TaxID=2775081 RepID=UPI001E4A8414
TSLPLAASVDRFSVTAPGAVAVNQPPVAAFLVAAAGLSVNVDGSGSSDPDGSIASHAWAFGDGATASGALASHTYSAAGSYTVTLVVTDDAGATTATARTVTVVAPPAGVAALDGFGRSGSGWGS